MDERYQEFKKRLNDVFIDVFDDEEIEIFDEMTAADIEEWDSLMHINLVVATEKVFNIQLNAADVGNLENVGQMLSLLLDRIEKSK